MKTVPSAFTTAVNQYADRLAIIGERGERLTYRTLNEQRLQAAGALRSLGVRHGDRVALWAPNGVEWVIAGLAIHSLGAVLVPINTRMKGHEAAYVLQKSRARVLFCIGRFLNQHYPTALAPHRPPTLEHVVVLQDAESGDVDWTRFMSLATPALIGDVAVESARVTPSDCMDILFTSGTTGLPKGVVTSHDQNLRVIADWSHAVGLQADDHYLIANPFFHSFGYKVGWLGGLLSGCTIFPHAVFDAGAILKRIEQDRISVLPGPPTLFISLLNDSARASTNLSSLRATITGAAAIAPSLIERIRAELGFKVVLTGYGLTETCGVVSLCEAQDDAETIALTSGKAIPDVELRCVDEHNLPLPAGQPGEIVVRGYNVMKGYFEDDEETRKAIDTDGWLHTGDIGILDAKGYLKITDRLKDMYITGGFNCYPAEIERLIAAHPAVSQVAIVGVADERQGEVGKAFVVPRAGQTLDEKSFITWCREHMANYKVPRYVAVVDALPTNASGKVLKFELRKAAAAA